MKFGHLDNIHGVDFTLPPNHLGIEKVLGGRKSNILNVFVGAPVWTHEEFLGKIYPEKARAKDFLKYYGQQFNSIELNATHYRVPEESTIKRWVDDVPSGFKFCPKIYQNISHHPDLRKCIPEIHAFYERISNFGDKLGTSFLQLPPTFATKQLDILLEFLDNNPILDLAVELRHESWFEDTSALNYLSNYLFKNKLSLNISDVAGRRDVLHQRLTNKTTFIRFVANNLHPSDYMRMDEWVNCLSSWIEMGLEDLYFFIHTPNKGLVPELSIYFIESLNKKLGLQLKPPVIIDTSGYQSLF